MNRKIVRIALVCGAAMVAFSPALAGHSWGNYHWARTSNPLKLEVVTAVTDKWPAYVTGATADWNATPTVLLLGGPVAGFGVNAKKCSAIRGKVLVCAEAYGQRGWLGLASIWASGNHITQATTKLNDSYFLLATYNKPDWRAMVTCQEIGHDFGLAHQDETFGNANKGSCMDYTNDPGGDVGESPSVYGPSNEHPDEHDLDQLAAIYSHTTDSTNTSATQLSSTNFGVRQIGQAPASSAAAANVPGDSPAEWGRAIATDGAGRPNVYVLDLGGGNRKITHVLWAIGEGPRGR